MTGTAPTIGEEDLRRLAGSPSLLVACDYDGTLAELVDDPARATPERRSIDALRSLVQLPATHVAIVSGRSLVDLESITGLSGIVRLVGSHGAEFDDAVVPLDREQRLLLGQLRDALDEVSARHPGTWVESKTCGVALHHRLATIDTAEALHAEIGTATHGWFGRPPLFGKDVVEFAVVDADKAAAITRLRHMVRPDAVLMLGDDVTDESAFAVLGPGDAGVKVGGGPTVASRRIADVAGVAAVLDRLVALRRSRLRPPASRDAVQCLSGESTPSDGTRPPAPPA